MSQIDAMAGGTGVVRVGALEVTVTPLTIAEERALDRSLSRAAKDAADPFAACAKFLDSLKPHPAAYLEAVRELTRLAASPGPTPEQFFEFRQSPAGVARELFLRGRKATPGLTAEGLAAVVTMANVDDVLDQLRAITDQPDSAGN